MTTPALVIGEALIDVITRPGAAPSPVVGGSPLNVAIGLRRLGIPSALRTHIGTDQYGAIIRRHLAANKVGLAPASVHDGRTSVAHATIGADGTARYRFDINWALTATEPESGRPALVHIGSIGAVVRPGGSVVCETVRRLRRSATVSYDPNVRPALMGDPGAASLRIESRVAMADVVKASDEDVAWLYPGVDLAAVAERWLALGPALVVITRGELGAHAVSRNTAVDVAAPAVSVADTIGAGDSFMAGLLAALHDHGLIGRGRAARLRSIDPESVRRVLELAMSCAAITVSRHGADPPTRAELDRFSRSRAAGAARPA
jgi:fructokinase